MSLARAETTISVPKKRTEFGGRNMMIARRMLDGANRALRALNVRVDTLTARRVEANRLQRAALRGAFREPVYPVPQSFAETASNALLAAVDKYHERFETFSDPESNCGGFSFENDFFSSPDAEVLYTLVRERRPKSILEIGCGNSTRVSRTAIIDGELGTRLTCVDPAPRTSIADLADSVLLREVESVPVAELTSKLGADSILFIDTSHEVRPGGDVQFIYCQLFPRIPVGTLVHIHDIFLPYDYPARFSVNSQLVWGEQYLVQVLLQESRDWRIVWPGYYLQQSLPDFARHFPHKGDRSAQSLWIERVQA